MLTHQGDTNMGTHRLRGDLTELLAVTMDLRKYFTGLWDHLSLVELSAACRLDAY